jgi:hypothetical protein
VTTGLEKEGMRLGCPLNIIIDVQPLHRCI